MRPEGRFFFVVLFPNQDKPKPSLHRAGKKEITKLKIQITKKPACHRKIQREAGRFQLPK